MNALEIKEKRKKLGLTQEQLAKLLGVSKRTVINYENGEPIPETKYELLHSILNQKSEISTLEEPTEQYGLSGYDKEIAEAENKIQLHYEIIRLLKTQIELTKNAKKNHKD